MQYYIQFRTITDIISITVLLTIALFHLLSYAVRSRHETGKSDLVFSLFVIGLAGYIFFDNTLSLMFFSWRIEKEINTIGVAFCSFLITAGFYNFLTALFRIPKIPKRIIHVTITVSFILFLASFSVLHYGYRWYTANINRWLVIVYAFLFCLNSVLLIKAFVQSGQFKSKSKMIFFLASHVQIVSLFIMKMLVMVDLKYFYINNFVILIFCALFFPVLLISKSGRDLRELAVIRERLRNMDMNADLQMQKINAFSMNKNINDSEKLVMQGLLKGLEYKEIADTLNYSLSAIKKRAHSIYRKTNVQNRAELIHAVFGIEV
ncbi:MAG: hypothetical protein JW874_05805 [Spirochaetales bacterium]|nr:hypothetical protein [Spirochaetales bacterium]